MASRIRNYHPNNVLDIGCGPGNSSHVLKEIFPHAKVIGIDNSSDMIEKANQTYSHVNLMLGNSIAVVVHWLPLDFLFLVALSLN